MQESGEHRLTIFDSTFAGEHHVLEAVVKPSGDLVLEGRDLGKSVVQVFGDSDFEYWRTVSAAHVPRVLLQLIKDRFKNDTEFKTWLEANDIPSEFECY